LISRWGRYREFPIAGTAVMVLGLFLLSRMNADTSIAQASIYMGVLGSGLGLVMQVLVIAVQNAVDYRDLGVATSGATLFRLIGGALGTAIFGAIFASQLAVHLRSVDNIALPVGAGVGPQVIAQLEPAARAIYIDAFTQSLSPVFLVAAGIGAIGFLLTWLIPEMPLRESIAAVAEDVGRETGDLFPMPTDVSSVERLERSLSLIASRDTRRAYVRQVVERAGIDLRPLASWLLVRLDQNPSTDVFLLARQYDIGLERLRTAYDELIDRGFIKAPAEPNEPIVVTDAGCAVLERLVRARREQLQNTLADWGPEKRADIAAAIARLSRDIVPDPASRH
jgi:MFS family permease